MASGSGTASADPDALNWFQRTEAGTATALLASARTLAAALDTLRASRPEMLPAVPPLDVDVARLARDADRLAMATGRVGRAFRDADTRQGALLTGPVTTTDTVVSGRVAWAGLVAELAKGSCLRPEEQAAGIRAYFAGLSPDAVEWLTVHRREHVGNLDGVPEQVRYEANRLRVGDAVGRLDDLLRTLLTDSGRADAQAHRRYLEGLLRPRPGSAGPRRFLLFDDTGLGRAAEVIGGPLADARTIAVMVPGMTSRLDPYFAGFSNNAAALQRATEDQYGPGHAVIAWQGYRAPQTVLEVASPHWAAAAGPQLDGFLRSQGFRDDQRLTVFAHSYGSVVTGHAAGDRDGLPVAAVVALGSPGMGRHVDHARDLRLKTGGRVYAAGAIGDIVSMSGAHGNRPIEADFGATRLQTGDGTRGHSSYYTGRSLLNLAAVATGNLTDVRTTPHAPEGLVPGIVDDRARWTEAEARELADALGSRMTEAATAAGSTLQDAATSTGEALVDGARRLDQIVERLGGLLTDGLPGLPGWRP